MYFTGFADEASPDIKQQISAVRELGWSNIEMRSVFGSNIAFMADSEFEELLALLSESGVKVNCFGSGIGNWAKLITDSPESSYDEMRRALPRLARLGTKLVRMMSFSVPPEERADAWKYEDEVVKRITQIVSLAADYGVVCLHENCANWGGLSYEHTLRLIERVKSPYFKLVFDTGNPVFNFDYRGDAPYSYQSSMEFYRQVRDFVEYIHIKDGRMEDGGRMVFMFPGEGDGCVREILSDLFSRGYDGGISIEPHMAKVFHDPGADSAAVDSYRNFIEYGRLIEKLVSDVRKG